jgi:Zn finger protein HypA/HybF involved in hydrogenase expression
MRVCVFLLMVSVAVAAPGGMFKVSAQDMLTRSYRVAGLHFSPIAIDSAQPAEDRPFDRVSMRVNVRNHADSIVHGYSIYLVAYSVRNRPLFSAVLTSGTEHDGGTFLELGQQEERGTQLTLPIGELQKVSYYALRIVVDATSRDLAPVANAVESKPPAKKCTNSKCIDGMLQFTAFGDQVRERKCPICDGKGWIH